MTAGRPDSEAPRIGVALGSIGATPQWWLESAIRLDAAGYPALWSWDHFVGGGDRTVPVVEQWTILAAAAGATKDIRLGTFISNVMNRHPAVLARMASTLHEASGGRLTLGVGIGGGPKEHVAYGIDFPEVDERVRRLEEAVGVIRALWTGGPVTRDGTFYLLTDAHAVPVPEPAPRILIGAAAPRGVRLAARIGDGWAAEQPDFEKHLGLYLDTLESAGKRRANAWIALGVGGTGKSGQDHLLDSPWITSPVEEWRRWFQAGADEVIVTARTTADVDALVTARDRW
ncbi:MAG TPA: LLM class flavin-dependent oxidoreductase [Candidatus Limnocylindrales bacterium]|nr:LLM class flavin-dependent oxidoreductase [Candidatus Limnocylindrales bacterium]